MIFLETWRLLFPTGGSSYVDEYISSFVDFYCHQIVADNHAVREAACACIAELAQKCSADALAKGNSLENFHFFCENYQKSRIYKNWVKQNGNEC